MNEKVIELKQPHEKAAFQAFVEEFFQIELPRDLAGCEFVVTPLVSGDSPQWHADAFCVHFKYPHQAEDCPCARSKRR